MNVVRLFVCIVCLTIAWPSAVTAAIQDTSSRALVPGDRPATFHLPDIEGVTRSEADYRGKVLVVVHADPNRRDDNEALCEAIKRAVADGRLSKDAVQGVGVADCQGSWLPKPLLRMLGRIKARKYQAAVLIDASGSVRREWGLRQGVSTVVILDKAGVCRFKSEGRLAPNRIDEVLGLLASLERAPAPAPDEGPATAAGHPPMRLQD